jgi:hypothetical protein
VRAERATASHPAWWLAAALAAGIVALGLAASTAAARASAERTAARLLQDPEPAGGSGLAAVVRSTADPEPARAA